MCRTTFTVQLILAPTIEDGNLWFAQHFLRCEFFVKLNGYYYWDLGYDDVPESHRLSLYESNAEWGRDLFMFLRQHQQLDGNEQFSFDMGADKIDVSINERDLMVYLKRKINDSHWTSLINCPVLCDIKDNSIEETAPRRLGSSRGFTDDSPQYQGQSNTAKFNRAFYRIMNHDSCHSFYIEEQRYKYFILKYEGNYCFCIMKCDEE
jgi:hypothetical protein